MQVVKETQFFSHRFLIEVIQKVHDPTELTVREKLQLQELSRRQLGRIDNIINGITGVKLRIRLLPIIKLKLRRITNVLKKRHRQISLPTFSKPPYKEMITNNAVLTTLFGQDVLRLFCR